MMCKNNLIFFVSLSNNYHYYSLFLQNVLICFFNTNYFHYEKHLLYSNEFYNTFSLWIT